MELAAYDFDVADNEKSDVRDAHRPLLRAFESDVRHK